MPLCLDRIFETDALNWGMKLLAVWLLFFAFDHGIYVSVTQVKQLENHTWEVSCRLFNTDLEDAIRSRSGESVALRTDADLAAHHQQVSSYITSKIRLLTAAGASLPMTWTKGSIENDTVWAYFTVNGGSIAAVENSLLVEIFSDQQNVVTIEEAGSEKKYLRFDMDVKRLEVR